MLLRGNIKIKDGKTVPDSEIIYGEFLEEIKNRFLCTVKINGTATVCYIPSSCRLSNFIDLTNREVMLQPIRKRNARTKYSVYAVKYRQTYVPLNLSNANRIIEKNLNRRIFSFLGVRNTVCREKSIDGYKCDLYIADTDTIVEIKSILCFNKTAFFPAIFSGRANQQLKNIKSLLEKGHKVCYIFVSLYSGNRCIFINEQQTEYAFLFGECMQKGMTAYAFSIGMNESTPFIKSRVKIEC